MSLRADLEFGKLSWLVCGGIQVRRRRTHSLAQRAIRFTVEDIGLAYSLAKTKPTSAATILRNKLGIELDTLVYGVATIERGPTKKKSVKQIRCWPPFGGIERLDLL